MTTVDSAYIDATPADMLDCIHGCQGLDNENEVAAEFIRLYVEAQCHKVKAERDQLLALVGEWRQAFIDILNPITYLQKGLAPDEKLDGSMALELAKTIYMQIAEKALAIAEQREASPPGYPPGKSRVANPDAGGEI